ncbi:MAG: type II toxin-antitoxin system VapC family toxin [Deltaproteobacteria bacterium]|nr:type II toxin-antitoxin system VapC family toxin [Deltaproteobacteria bacterium]
MIVLDTDILIDAGRKDIDAITCLRKIEQQSSIAISSVTQMELIVGCGNKNELRDLEKFLKRFQVIKLNDYISDMTVSLLMRYRLSHGLLIADALIAATAISFRLPFVSKNQRDYRFIPDLDLLPYPDFTLDLVKK